MKKKLDGLDYELEERVEYIWKLEDDFLKNPTNEKARGLIRMWDDLRMFKILNGLEPGICRDKLLDDFLYAENILFAFRRRKKKKKILCELKRIRYDN